MALETKVVREILRLHQLGHSLSVIAKATNCSKSAVKKYVDRAKALNAEHVVASALTDESLSAILQPAVRNSRGLVDPDWQAVFIQNTQQDLDLIDIWKDYVDVVGESKALGYSAFCDNYRKFKKHLPVDLIEGYLALDWTPGEYIQIDYSGDGIRIVDREGKVSEAQIFVASLPFSSYIFAYATVDQTRDSWLEAMIMMFRHLDGVPRYLLLDNTKSLVCKASKFNPLLSQDFKNFCRHYGIVADAVNPYSPTQKGAVENAVKQVQDYIIKPLQPVRFFDLAQVNARLVSMLEELNSKPMKARGGVSRKDLCLKEQPFFQQLPANEYELQSYFKKLRVRRDGCIRLGNARYTVPYEHIGKQTLVEVMPSAGKVIVRINDAIVAEHEYRQPAELTTIRKMEHLHPAQRFVLTPPEKLMETVSKCGPQAAGFCNYLHEHLPKPLLRRQLQGCLYFMSKTEPQVFEECCRKALASTPVNFEALQAAVTEALADQETKKPVIGNNKHRMPRNKSKSTFRGPEDSRLTSEKEDES